MRPSVFQSTIVGVDFPVGGAAHGSESDSVLVEFTRSSCTQGIVLVPVPTIRPSIGHDIPPQGFGTIQKPQYEAPCLRSISPSSIMFLPRLINDKGFDT